MGSTDTYQQNCAKCFVSYLSGGYSPLHYTSKKTFIFVFTHLSGVTLLFWIAPSERVCLIMFHVSSEKWNTYAGSSASALLTLGLCSIALRSPNFTLCSGKERRRSNEMKKSTLKSNMSHWLRCNVFGICCSLCSRCEVGSPVKRAEIWSKDFRCQVCRLHSDEAVDFGGSCLLWKVMDN